MTPSLSAPFSTNGSAGLTRAELEAVLLGIGAERYHHLHPFHQRLHAGACSRMEVQAWALNRYYYQSMIPVKDAAVLGQMRDPALRRAWRQRIIDHDGDADGSDADAHPLGNGGIARWLALTDGLGLSRGAVVRGEGILPATRFAVDAYVTFCRTRPLLEAIASSLTELFSPDIIAARVSGMLAHYPFVSKEILGYFAARPAQASRDVDFALGYVLDQARTPDEQTAVIEALIFKTDVLWAQLDALWMAYVERRPPPGAWGG